MMTKVCLKIIIQNLVSSVSVEVWWKWENFIWTEERVAFAYQYPTALACPLSPRPIYHPFLLKASQPR